MKKVDARSALYSKKDKRGICLLFVLFLLYSLYTSFGGDNERYESFVTESVYNNYLEYAKFTIEPLYYYIAILVRGDFLLWKLIVYGTALLVTYFTLNRINANNYTAMFAFSIFALSSYGTTRGVLAYSIFLFALILVSSKKRIIKFTAIVLCVFSVVAHSSMLLPIILLPLIGIKLNKTKTIVLLMLFPLLLLLFNLSYSHFFSNDTLMSMQTGDKLETYTDEGKDTGTGSSFLLNVHIILDYITILVSLYYSIIADNKGLLPRSVSFVVRLSFFLYYVAMIINFSAMTNGDFIATRYITMIPFFLFITWPFILNNRKVFTIKSQRLYLLLSVFDTVFLMLMISYYTFCAR